MTRDSQWLEDTLAAVDLVLFSERLHDEGVTIRWGRFRRATKSIRLGWYWDDKRLIELSQVLKHEWVPLHVVVSMIHHEGLHHLHGQKHTPVFALAEQRDPYFALTEAWIQENQGRLLAARPPREVKS